MLLIGVARACHYAPFGLKEVDLFALDRVFRIALGGDHHGHRGAGPPLGRCGGGQVAGRGGVQQRRQRGAEAVEHHLRLRVAEAGVELDHPQAGRGQAQARVQQAAVRRAAPAHGVHGRADDSCPWPARPGRPAPTAAARRRPCRRCSVPVAVMGALEVLRGQQRHRRRPVGNREQRHLGPVEELLDHHRAAAARRAPWRRRCRW